MSSLLQAIKMNNAPFIPSLNTGTQLDIVTGDFVPGIDNETILNGGISLTFGTTGRPQTYKSTTSAGYIINAFARCPGTDLILHNSEPNPIHENRLRGMSNIEIPKDNTITITTSVDYYMEQVYEQIIGIMQEKLKHAKDYTVKTPFIDPLTGKQFYMLRPTFFGIDSWTNVRIKAVEDMLLTDIKVDEEGEITSKTSITSKETNTAFMKDGLSKKKMIKEICRMAERANIFMFFTAHIGDKIDMDPYAPTSRGLQYMKSNDKAKGVGPDFMFLMSTLLDCRSATTLTSDDNKQALYPTKSGIMSPKDLNLVTQVSGRGKSGTGSGSQISHIVSQKYGLLPELSNYHYLKENKYYGFTGNNQRHQPVFIPDCTIQRTTIFDTLYENKRLARALEILFQLCFIQNNWTLRNMPVPFNIEPQELADKLNSSGYAINDILDSRGWWTYDEKNTQPFLSLFDILSIVNNTYKSKYISAKK